MNDLDRYYVTNYVQRTYGGCCMSKDIEIKGYKDGMIDVKCSRRKHIRHLHIPEDRLQEIINYERQREENHNLLNRLMNDAW